MIAIIDYGVGNLFSLQSSLRAIGEEVVVTADQEVIRQADHVILPGVGAFGDAVQKLRDCGLFDFVKAQAATGKPFLGICLGMQLLFDRSLEYGEHEGLGLIPGEVRPIEGVIPAHLDIPHMGWNALHFVDDCPLFRDLTEGDCVYFVHSDRGVRCAADRRSSEGQCLWHAVSPGEERGCRPEDPEGVCCTVRRNYAAVSSD